MKLKYHTLPPSEGGGAVPGCGTIHISEISPTLDKLSSELEFPFDLEDYTLGSVGKKEYSGDIDVVIETAWYNAGPKTFHSDLITIFGVENTGRNGTMVHLKYPIVGFDSMKADSLPRTGFVQVDFNFGDLAWERVYHHSPGDTSEYKGAHRNLIIAAITSAVNTETSPLLDFYDRPVSQIRWKWGSNGLIRVNRHGGLDPKSGKWSIKQLDTVLEGPLKDADSIARALFPYDGQASDLHSLETMMDAVKRNYGLADQERIWSRTAKNFADWKEGKYFIYPLEISRYFPPNDK